MNWLLRTGYWLLKCFGCSHPQLSRVFTMGKPPTKRSYQVCLECGAELDYDLVAMRLTGADSKLARRGGRNLKLARGN
jgi:hypothetical protein